MVIYVILHGQLVYMQNDDVVYSLYVLEPDDVNYTLRLGQQNGWRPLISAKVLASLKMLLWKMLYGLRGWIILLKYLPDGRIRKQRLVDYVTMDANYATPLRANGSATALQFLSTKGPLWL